MYATVVSLLYGAAFATDSDFLGSFSASPTCQIKDGMRFQGDIITQTYGTKADACCSLCAGNAECTGAQTLHAASPTCYLFRGALKQVADSDWMALAPGEFPPTPSPTPTPTPSPAPPGAIMSRSSGRCLDLPGGDVSDGSKLWVWDCYGGNTQKWAWNGLQIQYDGLPVWTHCVDVPGGAFDEGVQLELWQCNGLPQQDWGYDSDEGTVYLPSSLTDASMCMKLADANADGAPVLLAGCDIDIEWQWDVGAPSYSSAAVV